MNETRSSLSAKEHELRRSLAGGVLVQGDADTTRRVGASTLSSIGGRP
jgi:hypothetical protein